MAEENKPASKEVSDEGGVQSAEEFIPRKLVLYKHWVRPRTSQYRYMDDYRQNYYDDMIEYLDKRQKGLAVDPPRPQTWAERVLRTRTQQYKVDYNSYESRQQKENRRLLQTLSNQINSYNYHTRAYMSRKYVSLL